MVGNTNLARDGKNVGEIGTDRGLVDDVHVDIETLTLILNAPLHENQIIAQSLTIISTIAITSPKPQPSP